MDELTVWSEAPSIVLTSDTALCGVSPAESSVPRSTTGPAEEDPSSVSKSSEVSPSELTDREDAPEGDIKLLLEFEGDREAEAPSLGGAPAAPGLRGPLGDTGLFTGPLRPAERGERIGVLRGEDPTEPVEVGDLGVAGSVIIMCTKNKEDKKDNRKSQQRTCVSKCMS